METKYRKAPGYWIEWKDGEMVRTQNTLPQKYTNVRSGLMMGTEKRQHLSVTSWWSSNKSWRRNIFLSPDMIL